MQTVDGVAIVSAVGEADIATVASLFRDYAASLNVDLAYQNFDAELAGLPGQYAPPRGLLLLARDTDGTPLGCVACRPLDGDVCEMKRLFVAPAGRGRGTGRLLVRQLVAAAREAGYAEMWLDTLASMGPAQALYRAEGFEPTTPYYDTPIAGTVFMRRPLA
ncbi:GNAT family N-acetyltransferase [Sphingopyxis sp. DHUNG17]|uniref:GNAT family N-acetyltransferase n=1 Tax=Sphingopyxis jiangsuensis TaxID=2871171 RepID=UPI00191FF7FC|nr:GNAT family N-acetyltransferase [Sphingopyxis lutea]MBL0767642.1 GNAT family N-acetyltransferase [Sphingopyxis lutea]